MALSQLQPPFSHAATSEKVSQSAKSPGLGLGGVTGGDGADGVVREPKAATPGKARIATENFIFGVVGGWVASEGGVTRCLVLVYLGG